MPVPYTFANATTAIPLSQLDSNFDTAITLGNTAIQLGNTVTTLNNMTLANVTISSGTVSITNVAVTTANVSGTANISTLVVVGNTTAGGNVSVGGNVSISVNTSVSGNASVTGNISGAGGSFSSVTSSGNVTLSGGTANGVLYLNTSKVATSGTALTFDGTNLGIGTSSPGYKLDVNGNFRLANFASGSTSGFFGCADTGSITLNFGGSTSPTKGRIFYTDNSDQFQFFTNSTQRMTLDSSGNLGLGVTPSAQNIGKSIELPGGASLSGGTFPTMYLTSNAVYSSGWSYKVDGYATYYNQQSGQHQWWKAASGTAGNAITFTQAMTLDASGNLGIGTTSPDARLTLNGASNSRINMRAGDVRYGTLFADSGVFAVSSITSIPLVFGTNDTERARIDSSGNLGIGTTSPASFGKLSVVGTIAPVSPDGTIQGLFSAANTGEIRLGGYKTGGGTYLVFSTGADTERARIDSSGNFIHQVNGTAPSLSTNSTMSFELTSNTSLKIVVRGTDGTTRSATLVLV